MSWTISKKPKDEEEKEENSNDNHNPSISTHLYLKPVHTTGTLDKQVVLRRIRHRKRLNNLRAVANYLLGSIFSSKKTNEKSHDVDIPNEHKNRWVDDAFAAP